MKTAFVEDPKRTEMTVVGIPTGVGKTVTRPTMTLGLSPWIQRCVYAYDCCLNGRSHMSSLAISAFLMAPPLHEPFRRQLPQLRGPWPLAMLRRTRSPIGTGGRVSLPLDSADRNRVRSYRKSPVQVFARD